MKKIYFIIPDRPPYSLCAKSFAKGFRQADFFIEKSYSSELDNDVVLDFCPDYVMCFNFSELNEGLLDKIYKKNPKCIFIFDFLTALDKKQDAKNIKKLKNFVGQKLVLTADKSNLGILPDARYMFNGIAYKEYKSEYQGYENGITFMSNPDNINVLKVITDLISVFGKISIYADEVDYVNSLENELWQEIQDEEIRNLYKQSYRGNFDSHAERAEIFSKSFATVVPITQTPMGIDFRILEAAASSAFVLCEENPEVKRLFEVGKELETYKTSEDLADKIKFYLKYPSFARSIADNARRTAVNNFSAYDKAKNIIKLTEKLFGR